MKILTVVGSPRENANTHFLSQKFGEGAAKVGAEVEEIFLQKYSIAGCRHCFGCLKDGTCKIKDDYAEIKEKLLAADGILLASPVYCCSVTAQMKSFMDRSYSFGFPTWETGLEGWRSGVVIEPGEKGELLLGDPDEAVPVAAQVPHAMLRLDSGHEANPVMTGRLIYRLAVEDAAGIQECDLGPSGAPVGIETELEQSVVIRVEVREDVLELEVGQ